MCWQKQWIFRFLVRMYSNYQLKLWLSQQLSLPSDSDQKKQLLHLSHSHHLWCYTPPTVWVIFLWFITILEPVMPLRLDWGIIYLPHTIWSTRTVFIIDFSNFWQTIMYPYVISHFPTSKFGIHCALLWDLLCSILTIVLLYSLLSQKIFKLSYIFICHTLRNVDYFPSNLRWELAS